MEEKLNAYRRKKQQDEFWKTFRLQTVMEKLRGTPDPKNEMKDTAVTISPSPSSISDDDISIVSNDVSLEYTSSNEYSNLTLVTYFLYLLLWTTVFLIAVQLGFGAVYFVLSGLVAIYLNTRTGPKKEGELSAYSVFNPKCESIDGTLKAEHFEKQFNLIQHSPST